MNEILNGELSIELPEGFRKMTADELKSLYSTDFANIRGFWDEANHVVICVAWNVSNKLAVKLTDPKSLAKRAQKHLARAYKGSGFQARGLFATQIAGQDAHGVRYGYTMQGVDHDGETIVFLREACCYYLYYYTHSQLAQQNQAIHDQVVSSLAFQ